MIPPPLVDAGQQKKDTEHLRLLTLFHFILGGLSILGLGFLFFHFLIMRTIFTNPQLQNARGGPPPEEIFKIMIVVYAVIGFFCVLGGTLNVLSALFLKRRTNRMFSLIIAGVNCVQVPFGTALGVFTFLVLSRDSVRQAYESTASPP